MGIIPTKHRDCILQELHRDHPGSSRMKSVARSYLWWPGLDSDIERLAKSCASFQQNKNAPPSAPLHPWTWPSKPWQCIHIDFVGPFLGTSFLVIVDAHSKWPEIFEMTKTSAAKTIATLRHLFATYGLLEEVVSDNGPQFTFEEFRQFLKSNRVKHIRCAPYHPSSNGAVECFNQTFKYALKASEKDGRSISHRIADFLLTYRSTPHSTTNRTPSSPFLLRELRTRFSLLHPDVEKHVIDKQADQIQQHDQHAKSRKFEVNQKVHVRNLRPTGPKWIPGMILKQTGPLSFIVQVEHGLVWKRHVDHLRHAEPTIPTSSSSPSSITDDTDDNTFISPTSHDSAQDTDDVNSTRTYPTRTRHPPDRFM